VRDFHLRFCLARGWYDGFIDLLDASDDDPQIPRTGGAYVLGTSDTMLTYPWGSSPIFYIGKARNLRLRLSQHKKNILYAIDNHDENYRPRHQYGAALGAKVAWYSRRGPELPHNVEADLVSYFYSAFGSIPVANSQWPKRIRTSRRTETG